MLKLLAECGELFAKSSAETATACGGQAADKAHQLCASRLIGLRRTATASATRSAGDRRWRYHQRQPRLQVHYAGEITTPPRRTTCN